MKVLREEQEDAAGVALVKQAKPLSSRAVCVAVTKKGKEKKDMEKKGKGATSSAAKRSRSRCW